MSQPLQTSDANAVLRRGIYALLILASCAATTGRILSLDSAKTRNQEHTPFLSANDRSRWSTIRALVDEGTFVLDNVIFDERGGRRPAWHSIDLVVHRGHDGREHYYSSKPTLLTMILAGEYWAVKTVTRTLLAEDPLFIGRIMLILTNVGLLAAFLIVLAKLVERYGTTDWGRIFVMTAAAFGTFLTTFAITLNNHLPAAVTALVTIALVLKAWREPAMGWLWYAVAGLMAALTAANEMPALTLTAMAALALLVRSPLKTLVGFGPAAAIVAAAALGSNYYAHGDWKTPYAHRSDGPEIARFDANLAGELDRRRVPLALVEALNENSREKPSAQSILVVKVPGQRWELRDEARQRRWAIVLEPDAEQISIREWDNWYDYDGSYWIGNKPQGIDKGERAHYGDNRWLPDAMDETRVVYALQCLIGHHGLFSLTPIWLLSLCGLWQMFFRQERELRLVAAIISVASVVVFVYYTAVRPDEDLNYGGVTSGLRWMFWFIPLWLMAMPFAADIIAPRRNWRTFSLVLLAISVVSAHYAVNNPWSHPWLFDYWTWLGWIAY